MGALPDALVVRSLGDVTAFFESMEGPAQPLEFVVVDEVDEKPLDFVQEMRAHPIAPDSPRQHGSRLWR